MDAAFKRIFKKTLIRILIICVLTNWFVLGIYFWKFAPGNWLELSASQEIWAQFGDFYSGLMGPFLSFLAFVGILFTVLLQMKQLDLAKHQAEVQEMQRVLASISAQMDQMLNVVPPYYAANQQVRKDAAPLTLFDHISAFGTDLLKPIQDQNFANAFNQSIVNDVKQDISMSVSALALEFHSLGWALEKYIAAGGNETIVEFYKFRYGAIITWLDVMGVIGATSRIRSVIDLNVLRQAMVGNEPGGDKAGRGY